MSVKSANVSVRVQPEIKEQAELVLEKLGLPVSVVIDTLYRQIIMTGGIPYSLNVPKFNTLDSMTKNEFDVVMEEGYNQAVEEKGINVDSAFDELRKRV